MFASKPKGGRRSPLPPAPRPQRALLPEPPFLHGMDVPHREAPRPEHAGMPPRPPKTLPELHKNAPPKPPGKVPPKPHERATSAASQPPIFIKIDKYKDIINNMQELKSYSLGLRDAMDALGEIERELKNGLELSNRALDKFNTMISLLDAKLLKFHEGDAAVEIPKDMDEYVRNLYGQVEKIRHELRMIESEDGS